MNKLGILANWRRALRRESLVAAARRPRVRNTGAALLALFVLSSAALYFAGPPLLTSYLTETLSQRLGRKISVGKIRVNPFELSATIENFKLAEADGQTAFLGFRELYVNAQLASIALGGPVLREIRLTQPRVHLVRNADGRYNFDDLIDRFASARPSTSPKPPAKPPTFSLNNIQVLDGAIDFDDQPKQRRHRVSELHVVIPFLSTLFYRVDDFVQPEFSALVNGARFALSGQSKPFDVDRESNLRIKLDRLQLGPYLGYVPKKLHFSLPSGSLSADLKLAFLQPKDKAPALSLTGGLSLDDLELQEAENLPTLKLKQVGIQLRDIQPLAQRYAIAQLRAQDGALWLRRDRQGRINLANLVEPDETHEPPPWFVVQKIELRNIVLHARDEAIPQPFDAGLTLDRLDASDIGSATNLQGKIELAASGPGAATLQAQTTLALQPLRVQGQVALDAFPIPLLAPYYAPLLNLKIANGQAGFSSRFTLSQTAPGQPPAVQFDALSAHVDKLQARLPSEKTDLLQLDRIALDKASVDLAKRTIHIGEITARKAQLQALRDRQGRLNLTQIVRATTPEPSTAKTPGWQYVIDKIALADGGVRLRDESLPTETASLAVDHIQAQLEHLSSEPQASATLNLAAQMGRGGRIALDGKLAPQAQAAKLQLNLKDLPLLPVQPYFSDKVRITLTDGTVSARGTLDAEAAGTPPAQPKVRYHGDVQIKRFASVDQVNKNDFLKWDSLKFGNVQIDTAPLKISMDEILLNDFYSRLVINPDGRLNVQHIIGGSAQAAAGEDDGGSSERKGEHAAPKTASPAPRTPIRIARVVLQGGRVSFADHFIKPNYSANLTNIGGRVTGLSSDLAGAADVALRGQVDNAAPLEILGKVNPLSGNLFLDLAASAKGVDLPGVTPYSARYAGYPILKGKLSMDVKYHIADQKLEAQNHIVLDQLTFGEKVESPDATKLPVLLAVALLKDRNGVIDINLPIGGSLDDPDFSVGGIVVRVIVNLIAKAVTSPFALLGSLFPNSEQLAYIEFDSGRSRLDAAATAKIQNLAQALEQRPALKLDITGRVDPEADKEGLRRRGVERKVKAVKFEALRKEDKAPVSLDDVSYDPAEYPKLLKEAYGREKFPKPRNLVGLAKDLPVPEMEKLMLAHASVGDDELRQLALRRARAVADALAKTGKVGGDRVFVLEPKLVPDPPAQQASGEKKPAKDSRVDFSLK